MEKYKEEADRMNSENIKKLPKSKESGKIMYEQKVAKIVSIG